MKQFFILLFLITLFTSPICSQDYVGNTYLGDLEKGYFFTEFGLTVHSGVDLYRLNYTTLDVHGVLDTASGLVAIPKDKTYEYSVLAYHHGTAGNRYEVPGYQSQEHVLPALLGAYGFISLAPDYLGLGDSRGFHPYVHADSEASATKDMVLAAEAFYEEVGVAHKKRFFPTGYSQGGHAAMAAHRLFETEDIGYEVPAAAHMSGPYAISEVMKDLLLSDEPYPLVAYMPLVAIGYDEVYGIFDGDINNFFEPDYIPDILKYYNEEIDLWELNDKLTIKLNAAWGGAFPKRMIKPNMLDAINSMPDHPVNVALRDNDVYDWTPTADTRLFYCGADEQVAFQNSLTAEAKMLENGAEKIQAFNVNNDADHGGCVSPAVTATLFHFLAYRDLTKITGVEEEDITAITITAANGYFEVNNLPNQGDYNLTILGYDGVTQLKESISNGQDISHQLRSGIYIAMISQESTLISSQKVVVINN